MNRISTYDWGAWIGGNDLEGSWKWSDGTAWDFTHWMDEFPKAVPGTPQCNMHENQWWRDCGQDCSKKRYTGSGSWRQTACAGFVPFVCSVPQDIDEGSFHLRKIIKLTYLARQAGVEDSELWKEAANIKTLYMSKELITQGLTVNIGQMIIQPGRDRCVNGLLEKSHIAVLAEALILKFPSIFQNINVNATAEDLNTGFKIYTYLSLCPLEAKASLEFYKHLVRTEDPRSIIQTSFKHLEDGFLPEKKYTQLAKSFFKEITQFFNLKLGSNVR